MNEPLTTQTPEMCDPEQFTDAAAAVARLEALYEEATAFLLGKFNETLSSQRASARFRAFYPEVRITVPSHVKGDSRISFGHVPIPGTYAATITRPDLFRNYLTQQLGLLIKNHGVPVQVGITVPSHVKGDSRISFGHVPIPGTYAATITRPDLFRNYLTQQLGLLIKNHGVPVQVGPSTTPMPVHFAVASNPEVAVPQEGVLDFSLRDVFDVPDLMTMNDDIVNGAAGPNPDGSGHLAPFTAQRVDYSLARLSHYTATLPEHFQNHVLFTNYQFYVDEFEAVARRLLSDPALGYTSFVAPGNQEIADPQAEIPGLAKMPQMPAYHLKRADGQGITLVNIGVGPSNAKTATDHIAVLRPHAWLMVGHCAGLRNSQNLGDFVLAHAYLREDKVLDDDLPVWVPIPV